MSPGILRMLEPDDIEDWRKPLLESLRYQHNGLNDISVFFTKNIKQFSGFYTACQHILVEINDVIQEFKAMILKTDGCSEKLRNLSSNEEFLSIISDYIQNSIIPQEYNDEIDDIKKLIQYLQELLYIYQSFGNFKNNGINTAFIRKILFKKLIASDFKDSSLINSSHFNSILLNLIFRLTSLYDAQKLCLKSLCTLTSNYEIQEMEKIYPSPIILKKFDLFIRLTEIHSKLCSMFKPTLKNYVNDALQLEEPIDEIKYLSKEFSETITHDADAILAQFAKSYEYLKKLSLEELKTRIQYHFLEKFAFSAPKLNLYALEDPNISIEEHLEVLKDCIQQFQKFNHELMTINSKMDNELRISNEIRQIIGENKLNFITSKYINQLNTTRTYSHDISIALSNFDMALANIPLLDKNLFSEHAVYMISAEMPSLIQMNCKIDYLKDKIQEKVDNFNRIKRQINNLNIETKLYNETIERIKTPKKCKECLLEPVFYPSCGHVMCRNCWKICKNICPVCGQTIEFIIDINWEN